MLKKDGSRELFDPEKIRIGVKKALEKRPVTEDQIDRLVKDIEAEVRRKSEKCVQTRFIGELVIQRLKELDQVAYIRFTSVYKGFDDAKSFAKEVERLQQNGLKDVSLEASRIRYIKKRDGRVVEFVPDKITNAIYAAAHSIGGTDKQMSEDLAKQVVKLIEERFDNKNIPAVEDVQDLVEKVLVENGHYRTSKAFILYRDQHRKMRETKNLMLDVNDTIGGYLDKLDWRVKENSNEQFSFSGLLLYTSGKVIANYALNNVYPRPVKEAHEAGYLHIHDLSHTFIGYCAGWSLKNLLIKGFGGIPGKVDCLPAKHMNTVVHQMVNYIGCLQMEFAGAQAFSSVDTLLAPFVRADNMSFKAVRLK